MNKLFFDILNESNEHDENDICLISHETKDDTYLKLKCGHGFNYEHIFKEIVNQKKNYNKYSNNYLKVYQIKCPYCRNVQTGLLPQRNNFSKIYGVNSPIKYIEYENTCKYVYKYGKNKDKMCKIPCEFDYCNKHISKPKQSITYQNKCKYIFKRGIRKGEVCDANCENDYCKKHSK